MFKKFKQFLFPYLIKAYTQPQVAITGKSALDIPAKTVSILLLISFIFAVISGNAALYLLKWSAKSDLIAMPPICKADTAKERAHTIVVSFLAPSLKGKVSSMDATVEKQIQEAFSTTDKNKSFQGISLVTLTKFIQKSKPEVTQEDVADLIIGDFSRKWWNLGLLPKFNPLPEDSIADRYQMYKKYTSSESTISGEEWKRTVVMASVQKLRKHLSDDLFKPRRLIQAFGDNIQWFTFIFAIWGMLLILLRLYWIQVQQELNATGTLALNPTNENLWSDGIAFTSYLNDNYPRMFVPSRLIADYHIVKEDSPNKSVGEIVQERVEKYQDSVDNAEYEVINFSLWVTPTFGFIGTIFGIISAMQNASGIFQSDGPIEQGVALDKVSSFLGTAFDTTFVGLMWLVPLTFYLARLKKEEANFFQDLIFNATQKLNAILWQKGGNNG